MYPVIYNMYECPRCHYTAKQRIHSCRRHFETFPKNLKNFMTNKVMTPKLIIIRGLPGAGKTTYAKSRFPNYNYFDADQYWDEHDCCFDIKRIAEAHEWCKSKVVMSLKNGNNTVVANVFGRRDHIKNYLEVIDVDYELQVIRITSQFKSIHRVPHNTIMSMKRHWEKWKGEVEEEAQSQGSVGDVPDVEQVITKEPVAVGDNDVLVENILNALRPFLMKLLTK
jgi:hypothetical protein